MSLGKYMWVSDKYIIKGNGQINLLLELKIKETGNKPIKFRITSQGIYFNDKDIEVNIK